MTDPTRTAQAGRTRARHALAYLEKTAGNLEPLRYWLNVDQLTLEELERLETAYNDTSRCLREMLPILFSAIQKRTAQSVGSEMRHRVDRLAKDLSDCQEAKIRLGKEADDD